MSDPYTATAGVIGGVLNANAQNTAGKITAGGNQTAQQANERALAELNRLYGPDRAAYYSVLDALGTRFGLGAPTASAKPYAPNVDANPSRILEMFPDVMAEYQRLSPNNLRNNLGISTPEQFATWWWNQSGQFEPWRAEKMNGGRAPETSAPGAAGSAATGPAAAPGQTTFQSIPSQISTPQIMAPPPPVSSGSAYPGQPAPPPVATYQAPTYADPRAAPELRPYQEPPAFASPTYQAPTAFSYDLGAYESSPGYEWQVGQAQQAILANAASTGSLQSGAALKALQDRSQQMAYQDYDKERSFAYNQYQADRNFGYGQFQDNRTFDYNRYVGDRDYGRSVYQDDRNYDRSVFQNDRDFGRAVFDKDRDYGRAVYQDDRTYGRSVYQDDRNYLTNRYDTDTRNLLDYAGMTRGALAPTGQAYLGYGSTAAGLAQNTAAGYADAARAQGAILSGVAGSLGSLAGMAAGGLQRTQSSPANSPYSATPSLMDARLYRT